MSDKELYQGTERLNKIVSIKEQGRQRSRNDQNSYPPPKPGLLINSINKF